MGWQDILNSFKEQFSVVGPEKYANIDNPDLRYQLAADRNKGTNSAVGQVTGLMANQNAEQIAAAKAAEAEKQAKIKEGYTRQYNKSGGYTFYNPAGKEVSPLEFSMSKGISLTDALQGSYDPGDIQFLDDVNAMKTDVASGRMDYNRASELLAQDYPNIFLGSGNPTGGTNYDTARSSAGKDIVSGGDYSNMTGNKKVDKQITTFAQMAPNFKSYAEAMAAYNQILVKTKFKTQTERKAFQETIASIIDEIFPSPYDANNAKNLPI